MTDYKFEAKTVYTGKGCCEPIPKFIWVKISNKFLTIFLFSFSVLQRIPLFKENAKNKAGLPWWCSTQEFTYCRIPCTHSNKAFKETYWFKNTISCPSIKAQGKGSLIFFFFFLDAKTLKLQEISLLLSTVCSNQA